LQIPLIFHTFAFKPITMQIVNPLYDKAFKYLMENNRLAKKVLEVILEKQIDDLSLGQQETIYPDEKRGLTLFRLDFKATITETDGTKQSVLIELQKSKYETDIQRFRNYLGLNYVNTKSVANHVKSISESDEILPIITIYILGYLLEDLPYLAVTVNRRVIDSVNKQEIDVNSFFVNHLTHRSHILQVRRLPEQRKSRLEQFLTFFNQAWQTEKKYIIDLQDIPEEFNEIAQYLQFPVLDSTFRKQLEAEEELDTIFNQQEAKYLKQIEEAKLRENEAAQREEEAKQKLRESARQMKQFGMPSQQISNATGLSEEEIKHL